MTDNMRNIMMKITKIIAFMTALAATAAMADMTPLEQAMRLKDKITEVQIAIKSRGIECSSFNDAPQAIKNISYINEFMNGVYEGPITIDKETWDINRFKGIDGSYDVYMPNLTSFGNNPYVFEDAIGLRSFSAPKLTSFGSSTYTFYNCYNLESVYLPELTGGNSYTFSGCTSLTNVYIPKNRMGANSYAFQNCSSLKDVNILPLTAVGMRAFYGCTSLTNVPLDKSSVTFNSYCFYNCTSLDIGDDSWPDSVAFSATGYQFYNCKSLKSINGILSKVTGIDGDIGTTDYGHQFQGCTGLTDIYSDSITTLNSGYLFAACTSVTNISFPNLGEIGSKNGSVGFMFNNMSSLKHIDMPKLTAICKTSSRDSWSIFAYLKSLEEVEFPSLMYIGNMEMSNDGVGNLFYNCNNLKSARFPALLELAVYGNSDSHSMFSYCYKLEDLQMPSLRFLRNIAWNTGNCSFIAHNHALKHINFPNLEQIWQRSDRLFYHCMGLKSVSFPKLTYINNGGNKNTTKGMGNMFCECPSITDVTFGMTAAELKAYPGFPGNAPLTAVFHCPAESLFDVDIIYRTNAWEVVTNGTYQLAKYIQGDGGQYFSTGYTHGTNTVVEIDFALVPQAKTNQYDYIFGSRKNSDTANSFAMLSVWNKSRKLDYMRNSNAQSTEYSLDVEKRFRAVCSLQTCNIYDDVGQLLYSLTASGTPNEGVGPLAVFTANNATSIGAFSPNTYSVENMKLYRFTIREDSETVMDLLPAVRSDGTACVVDAANNWHPIFNHGTGNFTAGDVTNSIPAAVSGE